MAKELKTRKIRSEDVLRINSIQEAIIKKRVSRRWTQMVEDHLRKHEGVGFVASRDGQVVGFIIGEVKGKLRAGAERLDRGGRGSSQPNGDRDWPGSGREAL